MTYKTEPRNKRRHVSTFQIIILGFFLVILFGSLLLMLPIASRSGERTGFFDALFTATSASCVTGLVVHDTGTYWSAFGQGIILMLIQIGGLGVVTIALSVSTISGRKIGLMQRSTMQESISAPQVGGIVRITNLIFKTTIVIELLGTVLLVPVFCKEFGAVKGVWYALFHSVSAFCNAGFDLLGVEAPFSSLTGYSTSVLLNSVIMLLIITGGVGFLTWDDIRTKKWHFKKYRMQSKVILVVSALLILLPALFFFVYEFKNLPLKERILVSLFQAVTPRTAGFNTVQISAMSQVGQMLIILLMLIGGSPGSTAGGMKTTTIAVLFSSAISVFRKKDSTHFFGRRIADETVKIASTVLLMYLVLFSTSGMIICCIDGIPLQTALFETASAIGTVGLSAGSTAALSTISRLILICLMFIGRVGGLTVIYAAVSEKHIIGSKYPQEKITVG